MISDDKSLNELCRDAKPKPFELRLVKGGKKSFKIVGLYADPEMEEYCDDLSSALETIADAFPDLLNDEGAPDMAERFASESTEIPQGVEPVGRGRLRLAWGGS